MHVVGSDPVDNQAHVPAFSASQIDLTLVDRRPAGRGNTGLLEKGLGDKIVAAPCRVNKAQAVGNTALKRDRGWNESEILHVDFDRPGVQPVRRLSKARPREKKAANSEA